MFLNNFDRKIKTQNIKNNNIAKKNFDKLFKKFCCNKLLFVQQRKRR